MAIPGSVNTDQLKERSDIPTTTTTHTPTPLSHTEPTHTHTHTHTHTQSHIWQPNHQKMRLWTLRTGLKQFKRKKRLWTLRTGLKQFKRKKWCGRWGQAWSSSSGRRINSFCRQIYFNLWNCWSQVSIKGSVPSLLSFECEIIAWTGQLPVIVCYGRAPSKKALSFSLVDAILWLNAIS